MNEYTVNWCSETELPQPYMATCIHYSRVILPYLHGTDTETPVDDKLAQARRSFVAVPSMNHQEASEVFKLCDGEICR